MIPGTISERTDLRTTSPQESPSKSRQGTTVEIATDVTYGSGRDRVTFSKGQTFSIRAVDDSTDETVFCLSGPGAALDYLDGDAFERHVRRGEFVIAGGRR